MKYGEQAKAAREIGIRKESLNAIIKGRAKPSLKLAIEIEKKLGIKVEDLLPEAGELIKMRKGEM